MEDTKELIERLKGKNTEAGCEALKILERKSEDNDEVYKYFDIFVEMLESENSYIRTRGIILIAKNAKWDKDNKLDVIIDEYLKHISDIKPITSRQCIKQLENIARYKSELRETIANVLMKANTEKYNDSMRPLIDKDIAEAIRKIQDLK